MMMVIRCTNLRQAYLHTPTPTITVVKKHSPEAAKVCSSSNDHICVLDLACKPGLSCDVEHCVTDGLGRHSFACWQMFMVGVTHMVAPKVSDAPTYLQVGKILGQNSSVYATTFFYHVSCNLLQTCAP